MQLYQCTTTLRLSQGTLVGLSGVSLTDRLPHLVEPYLIEEPPSQPTPEQGTWVVEEELDLDPNNKGYLLVTLNYPLDFKPGEVLLLDPQQAKGLALQPYPPAVEEAHTEPPSVVVTLTAKTETDLPTATELLAKGEAIGKANGKPPTMPPPIEVDPLANDPHPNPLPEGEGATEAGLDPVGEPPAPPEQAPTGEANEGEDESLNANGD